MIVRSYTPEDRLEVERIHFETGFLGRSMDMILSDSALWDQKIAWYLDREPESAFVLDDGSVVGYLVGCLDDTQNYELHPLRAMRHFVSDAVRSLRLPAEDRQFWMRRISHLGEVVVGHSGERHLKTPENAGHLHINLVADARGRGYGTKLLRAFESYALSNGVATLHAESFETRVNPNSSFWDRNGFEVYSRVPTTFWKPFLPDEDVSIVSYSKRIAH